MLSTYIIKNQILLKDDELKRKKRRAPATPRASSSKLSSKIHAETDFSVETDCVDEMDIENECVDEMNDIGDEIDGNGAEHCTYEFPEDNHSADAICMGDIDSNSDLSEEMEFTQTDENDAYVDPNNIDQDEFDDTGNFEDHGTPENVESLPDEVVKLREDLRGGYTCPQEPPGSEILPRALGDSEIVSLAHYLGWWKTNSTVEGYNTYRNIISNISEEPILSLHNVRKLAESLVHFRVVMVDMCPMSCMAYTGLYANLTQCTHHVKKNEPCNQPRYRNKAGPPSASLKKPTARKQFAVLPVMTTIRALFANGGTSRHMRYRDSCLREALHLVGTASMYSDFPNSSMHVRHVRHMNLFKDPRDVAFALSSDGAQLTIKRQSNTWVVILILLNLPGDMRYKSDNVIINLAIPGPQSPQNLDSFIYPLFQEMSRASEGLWIWDAIDSKFFILRAYITMGLGDMPGSAKLNGMAGHTAVYGDRFSLIKGAKTSEKGSKRIYYPFSPPESQTYNKDRPTYEFNKLPLRTQAHYWETIRSLGNATSDAQRTRVTQKTGISRLTLCTASPAFIHPSFFPFDPFHLLYENCMAFFWDLWVTIASASEDQIRIKKSLLQQLGEYLPLAMTTLPPAFCGPIRDVYLKRQSQYKIYEWMGLAHWYMVPMLLELKAQFNVIDNFAQFSNIVEYAMTIIPRSEEDIAILQTRINSFLREYERLYVGNNPANVSRCRLCIFQLIHIPAHIRWNGSVRLGSQATVERSIGELGHRIRSLKAPFANLMRLIKEKELIKILQLYYPQLTSLLASPSSRHAAPNQMFSRQPPSPKKKLRGDEANQQLRAEIAVITKWLGSPLGSYERWGKIRLQYRYVLRSALYELPEDPLKRHYRWFKARGENNFGEALAFYRGNYGGGTKELVVYRPLVAVKVFFNAFIRGKWSNDIQVMEISHIVTIVGIWRAPGANSEHIYVLQKHPGLEMLQQHNMPVQAEVESEDATEDNE